MSKVLDLARARGSPADVLLADPGLRALVQVARAEAAKTRSCSKYRRRRAVSLPVGRRL